eukprot:TRINITY_DN8783_c0_g1_i2.p1 TRINITY_DN8783_c0_g1~~TRINITY_DN8783_c0_g1_i2.p1  ORF type:complete len:198 (+),score=20.19 TRINITY_DN8783_c0_g1_i2:29-622(+)
MTDKLKPAEDEDYVRNQISRFYGIPLHVLESGYFPVAGSTNLIYIFDLSEPYQGIEHGVVLRLQGDNQPWRSTEYTDIELHVLQYLHGQGIHQVPKPIKNTEGGYYCTILGRNGVLFEKEVGVSMRPDQDQSVAMDRMGHFLGLVHQKSAQCYTDQDTLTNITRDAVTAIKDEKEPIHISWVIENATKVLLLIPDIC